MPPKFLPLLLLMQAETFDWSPESRELARKNYYYYHYYYYYYYYHYYYYYYYYYHKLAYTKLKYLYNWNKLYQTKLD